MSDTSDLIGSGIPALAASTIVGMVGTVSNLTTPLGADAWSIDSSGNLNQDSTNGASIALTKNSTAVGQPAATGVAAAGSTISDATLLNKVSTNVTTAAAGTGVLLWDAPLGSELTVRNESSVFAPLNVYPPTASISINSRSNGTPYILSYGECGKFTKVSSVLWIAEVGINQETSNSVSAAGTTITDATDLANPVNNVTTVAAGAGVQLYEAAIGARVIVRNGGNAVLSVYPPTASGTINSLSAGVAFTLNSQQVATFTKVTATVWIAEFGVSQGLENGITAAGTTISDAFQLTRLVNSVTTVGANSGVKLFQAPTGMPVIVRNNTVTTLKVYPPDASSSLNGDTNGDGISLVDGTSLICYRLTASLWLCIAGVKPTAL